MIKRTFLKQLQKILKQNNLHYVSSTRNIVSFYTIVKAKPNGFAFNLFLLNLNKRSKLKLFRLS